MSRHSKATAFRPVRHDRLLDERNYDAYRNDLKYAEPTVCPQCHAVFRDGRWQWTEAPPPLAQATRCPACRRIDEKFPVGFVHLTGDYFMRHRDELLQLVNNEAKKEQNLHPLERIMGVADEDEGVLVTTTGFHLARRLGEALHSAHQGTLDLNYDDAEDLMRVFWRR